MIHSPCSNIQVNSWSCLKCSWRLCDGLRGDTSMSHLANASYNTHEIVECYTDTYVIILALLHHWWGAWFKPLVLPISSVRSDYVLGVVGFHDVVCGVIHPCQMWSIPHIISIKWLHIISIQVWSSLDHYNYTADEYHSSNSWFQYPGY